MALQKHISQVERSCWLSKWGFDTDRTKLPRSAYIHIPFCHHRCGYCNFTVVANRIDLVPRFLGALETELSALGEPREVETIYVGGGTPTLLSERDLVRLIESIQNWLPLAVGGEFTIEANPSDLTELKCRRLVALGVNRVSLGGQSFNNEKLRMLERHHTGEQLRDTIVIALRHFRRVSLDLIFGVPGESTQIWKDDLDGALASGVSHLSTYGLTYEKGAQFWSRRASGRLIPISEDMELAMYELAIDQLASHGWEHYEVSSFTKLSHRSRHNQAYWRGDQWWAFGPGAARFLGNTRSVNHRSTTRYLSMVEANACPATDIETLDTDTLACEQFVFGMRLLEGICWDKFSADKSPRVLEPIRMRINEHVRSGWLEETSGCIRLTRLGLMISDCLWPDYLRIHHGQHG